MTASPPGSWPVARSGPVAAWLFLRALGAIYLSAFFSLLVQIDGLIGPRGVLPAAEFLESVHRAYGARSYWLVPSVFWMDASTVALQFVSGIGVIASLLVLGDLLTTPALAVCWVLYLSICGVGSEFLSFQWDSLLLEAGALALFASAWPEALAWLFRWLLFRLVFMSGLVKLLSGDSSWRDLSALTYHFETQPLPNPISWYVHQLPASALKGMTLGTFFCELVVPFFYFGPRRLQVIGAAITVAFECLIFLTGNYTFFNLLTMALALWLLDDETILRKLPARIASIAREQPTGPPRGWMKWPVHAAVAILIFVNVVTFLQARRAPLPEIIAVIEDALEPLRLSSGYGLFAVMTTARPEIVFEGSDDGRSWSAYEFRFKPGDERRPPPWVAPYHPRLDWQMWFAALSGPEPDRWTISLAKRLLDGSPPVTSLLAPGRWTSHPPRYVRAMLYDYRFSNWAAARSTGVWWTRQIMSPYLPSLTLDGTGALRRAE